MAETLSTAVVAMGTMAARLPGEGVCMAVARGLVPPPKVLMVTMTVMMAMVIPMPMAMVVTSMSHHLVPHSVENFRRQSIDDHLTGTEVIVVPAASREAFASQRGLDPER